MGKLGTITRRTLLVGAVAIAGGVAFGAYKYKEPYDNPLKGEDGEAVFNPYVMITKDNAITIIAPRAEMGQGISTTLAAMVAEELDVDLEQIKVIHGPAAHAYFNGAAAEAGGPFPFYDESFMAQTTRDALGVAGKFLGLQVTGGSTSTIDGFVKMRLAGASARETLKAAAAKKLNVDAASLTTQKGVISDPASGKTLTYGEIAMEAAKITPVTGELRDPKDWRILGKSAKRVDLREKVTGAPIYGIDTRLPEQLYGTVRLFNLMPSEQDESASFKKSLETAAGMPGVKKLVKLSSAYGSGYGIIATNTWAAFQAAQAIENTTIEAKDGFSDEVANTRLDEALKSNTGDVMRDDGDIDTAFADAPANNVLEATYQVPYLAHTTMEPMNATALLKDGALDVWVGNQAPTLLRTKCAQAVELPLDKVSIHTPMMGGGFGRRAEFDAAIYAAQMAKAMPGNPIKVTWTREEDVKHDTYRPPAKGIFKAIVDEKGPSALDMRIASPSVTESFLSRAFPDVSPMGPDKQITEGAIGQPLSIENYRVTGIPIEQPMNLGFWRSVGCSYNGFFHECFMDEIAHKSGLDPIDMRIALMKDNMPAQKVMEKLKEISNWSTPLGEGKARGVAFTAAFGSYVGEVVEISQVDGSIKIDKVYCVADLGQILDPGIVEAQMMSGIVYGLSSAMMQEITIEAREVQQSNFPDYDAMRMDQAPEMEIVLLENSPTMGGAGEPGTPPSIPALVNAVHALTGKRIRKLPLSHEVDFV